MRRLALAAVALALAGCSSDDDTKIYRVPSSSMEPTLHCGRPGLGCGASQNDLVAVKPYGEDDPERGDIVAFRTPQRAMEMCGAGGTYIKRVVGLPGERWKEVTGVIYIDGHELAEPYLRKDRRDEQTYRGSVIPSHRYLLLGDNRRASCDSRVWGLADRSTIIGKAIEIKRGSKRIHIR